MKKREIIIIEQQRTRKEKKERSKRELTGPDLLDGTTELAHSY
jgi:hypothetical protein